MGDMLLSFMRTCPGEVSVRLENGVLHARDASGSRELFLPEDMLLSTRQSPSTSSLVSSPTVSGSPLAASSGIDHDFDHQEPRTPVKRRKWVGRTTDTLRPEHYRGEHMLWGTNRMKKNLGFAEEEELPRNITDARNHFKVITNGKLI